MGVLNVSRSAGAKFGGGGVLKGGVTGVKELERKLKALLPDNPDLVADLRLVMGQCAAEVRDEMKSQAASAGWARVAIKDRKGKVLATGQQAIDSMFASSKGGSENPRQRISALAGLSKRRSMVEWIAGKHPRSPAARVAPGNPVAMSLAAMLEFGTTEMAAKPAIRTAITGARQAIIDKLTEGYNALLVKYSA